MKLINVIGAAAVVVALVGLYKNTDWFDHIHSEIYFKPEPKGDVRIKCADAAMDLAVVMGLNNPAIDQAMWAQKQAELKSAGDLDVINDEDYRASIVKNGSKALTESMSEMGFLWSFDQEDWEKSKDNPPVGVLRVNDATLSNLRARLDWCLAHQTSPRSVAPLSSAPTPGVTDSQSAEPSPTNVSQAQPSAPSEPASSRENDRGAEREKWADNPWADDYRQIFADYRICMWNTIRDARQRLIVFWSATQLAKSVANACGDERQAAIDFRMKRATNDGERAAIENAYSSEWSGENFALRLIRELLAREEQSESNDEQRGGNSAMSYQECINRCPSEVYVPPSEDLGPLWAANLSAQQCRAAC